MAVLWISAIQEYFIHFMFSFLIYYKKHSRWRDQSWVRSEFREKLFGDVIPA